MSHECHEKDCKRGKFGLAIPTMAVETSKIVTVGALRADEWRKSDGSQDVEYVIELGVDLANFCFNFTPQQFPKSFKEHYAYLLR